MVCTCITHGVLYVVLHMVCIYMYLLCIKSLYSTLVRVLRDGMVSSFATKECPIMLSCKLSTICLTTMDCSGLCIGYALFPITLST